MGRYVLQFAGVYALGLVVSFAAAAILKFNLPSAMGIIILMGALTSPIQSFVKAHKRIFLKGERLKLATGVGMATLAVNGVLTAVSLLIFGGLGALDSLLALAKRDGISGPLVIAAIAALSFAVVWLVTYVFSGGFFPRQVLKQVNTLQDKA